MLTLKQTDVGIEQKARVDHPFSAKGNISSEEIFEKLSR